MRKKVVRIVLLGLLLSGALYLSAQNPNDIQQAVDNWREANCSQNDVLACDYIITNGAGEVLGGGVARGYGR